MVVAWPFCSTGIVTQSTRSLIRPFAHPLSELTTGLWFVAVAGAAAGGLVAGAWGAALAAVLGLLVGSVTVALVLAGHFAEPRQGPSRFRGGAIQVPRRAAGFRAGPPGSAPGRRVPRRAAGFRADHAHSDVIVEVLPANRA
jgi:hypothetical protein